MPWVTHVVHASGEPESMPREGCQSEHERMRVHAHDRVSVGRPHAFTAPGYRWSHGDAYEPVLEPATVGEAPVRPSTHPSAQDLSHGGAHASL